MHFTSFERARAVFLSHSESRSANPLGSFAALLSRRSFGRVSVPRTLETQSTIEETISQERLQAAALPIATLPTGASHRENSVFGRPMPVSRRRLSAAQSTPVTASQFPLGPLRSPRTPCGVRRAPRRTALSRALEP